MKYIDIHSLPNIDREYDQNIHMFLTHLVEKDEHYRKVARECKGFKILDNSLIEMGSAMDPSRVIEAALEIGANEVVLPDVFCDGLGTMTAIQESLPVFVKEVPWCQRMAVVQGRTLEEWLDCLRYIEAQTSIDTIGIPKICAKMHPRGRRWFVERVIESGTTKNIHLLGLWYTYQEFNKWPDELFQRIRSVDTIMEEWFDKIDSPVRPDGWTIDLETGEVIKK